MVCDCVVEWTRGGERLSYQRKDATAVKKERTERCSCLFVVEGGDEEGTADRQAHFFSGHGRQGTSHLQLRT